MKFDIARHTSSGWSGSGAVAGCPLAAALAACPFRAGAAGCSAGSGTSGAGTDGKM